jgi:hypothetical protein
VGNEATQTLGLTQDFRPPTIAIEVQEGKRPIWKITVKDKKGGAGDDDDEGSGVERGSIKVTLTSSGTINTGFKTQVLVKDGRYQEDFPEIKLSNRNPVKKDDLIDDDTFRVQAASDLLAGNYVLRVEVEDKARNPARENRPLQVK